MTRDEITDRLEDLYTLFQASQEDHVPNSRTGIFSVGERIAINQERGALYTQLGALSGEILKNEARNLPVSNHINKKIIKTVEIFHNNQTQA